MDLRTYKFRSLPATNKRAASWLKRNPMECTAWAASVVCKVEDEDGGVIESSEDSSEAKDGRLSKSEKDAMRWLSLSQVLTTGNKDDDEVCFISVNYIN